MDLDSFSSNSSNKNLCECVRTNKSAQRVAKAGCADDDDAVAALPDDWVPRRSGPILTNYLKQREQDHEELYDSIVKCAADVNVQIDSKIRTLAENLLAHINQNQLDMDCAVQKCSASIGPLTKIIHDDVLKLINKLSQQRIEDVAKFKREASALERERAEYLKNILREKFQRLIAVGHMTPKELLHDFDERIYEINQQLLSNSRAFTELEGQLRVQVDESVVSAKRNLNQLALGLGVVYRGRNSRSAIRYSIDEQAMQRRPSSADQIRHSSEPSIGRSFLGDVKEIDACVGRLVQAYRTAVLKVYTGYYNKLDDLGKDLCSHLCPLGINEKQIHDFLDFNSLIDRPMHRLSSLTKKKTPSKTLMEITGTDVKTMQTSLLSLGECLQNTYSILNNAGHLWDAHILRSALAQKLTIAAVEDLLTSNDTLELTNEVPLNIAEEQLRCSSDIDKLNQQYDAIIIMLSRISEMYLQHSEAELGRLEEFLKLPSHMANTLLSEFDTFLEKYPRNHLQSSGSVLSVPVQSPTRKPSALGQALPRAIFQTELQEVALQNWRNGFLESFQGNISLVPEELKHQAQLWVEERSTSLHMRYSLKMISHSIRVERIKAIRDARLAELRYHEARLESHLDAVRSLVDRLPIEASEFAAVDASFLYPLVKWIDRIRNSVNGLVAQDPPTFELRKLKMASYALRLPKYRQLFETSLDTAVAEYKLHLEQRVQEVRISNVRFISQIKMFNEGGRYSALEATKTCSVLTKASEALEVCSQKALDALNQRRTQLLAQADAQLLPLLRLLDDTNKPGNKSTVKQQEKAKPKK